VTDHPVNTHNHSQSQVMVLKTGASNVVLTTVLHNTYTSIPGLFLYRKSLCTYKTVSTVVKSFYHVSGCTIHLDIYYIVPVLVVGRAAQWEYRLSYGLGGLRSNPGGGNIFRTCPTRPRDPPSLSYNGYRVIPGGKSAGACR